MDNSNFWKLLKITAIVLGIAGFIIGAIILGIYLHNKSQGDSGPAVSKDLISILKKKNAKLYGASSCPHTQQQLKDMGYSMANPPDECKKNSLVEDPDSKCIYVNCSDRLTGLKPADINPDCWNIFKDDTGYHGTYPFWKFDNKGCAGIKSSEELKSLNPCKCKEGETKTSIPKNEYEMIQCSSNSPTYSLSKISS